MERAERRANRRKELENNKSNVTPVANGFKAVTLETNVVANGDSITKIEPVVAKTDSNKKVEVKLNGSTSPPPEDKKNDVLKEQNDRTSDEPPKNDLLARRAERRRMRLAAEEEKIKAQTEKPVESANVESTRPSKVESTRPSKVEESKENGISSLRKVESPKPSKVFEQNNKEIEANGKASLKKVDLMKQTEDNKSSLRKTNFDTKPSSRHRPGSTAAVDIKAKFETNGTTGVDSLKKRPVSMNVRSKFESSPAEQKPVKFELLKTTSVPPKSTTGIANKFEGQSRLNKFEKKNELVENPSTAPKTNGFARTERSVTKTETTKSEGPSKHDIKEIKVVEQLETKTTTAEKTTTVTETKTTTPRGTLTTKKTETKLESSSKPGLKKTDSKSK